MSAATMSNVYRMGHLRTQCTGGPADANNDGADLDSDGDLEIVLALFMVSHAATADTWVPLVVCLVLMPAFGAMAAAGYWIFAVV